MELYVVAKQNLEKTKVEIVYRNLPQTEQWTGAAQTSTKRAREI